MISVVIPTEGIEAPVVATLAALVPGAAAGVIREVTLVERTQGDAISRVADVAGCHFITCEGSRSAALAAGVKRARSEWLMFLHPGAVLDAGWIDETAQFIQTVSLSGQQRAASSAMRARLTAPTVSPIESGKSRARSARLRWTRAC
jgi:hypothetical protein